MPFVPDSQAAASEQPKSRFVPDKPRDPELPALPGEQGYDTTPTPERSMFSGFSDYLRKLGEANDRALSSFSPVGTLEAAGTLLSGAVAAPILGTMVGIDDAIAGREPNPDEAFARFTYQPRTQSGKDQLAYLGALASPLTESGADVALGPLFAGESQAVRVPANAARPPIRQPAVSGAGRPVAATGAPAQAVQGSATAGRQAGLAGVPAAAEKTSAQVAREAGFVLKPSEAGGKGGSIAEGLSGSAKLETAAIIKNSRRADQLAAEEIGIKELKAGAIAKARGPHSAVYRELGTLGEVPVSAEFTSEIANIGRAPGNSFAKAINSEVEQLKQQYTVERFNAKDAVQETRELRFKARKNLKSQDPAKNELGAAQLKVSDAIENQLERHAASVGKGDMVARFKKARQELAKINTVVGAMRNGRISPEILAKQLDAGVPLSGNLRTIAQVAKDYPNVMRNAAKVKGATQVNMFETMAGMGGIAATAMANPALAVPLIGAAVSRPITRAALLSERYQNRLGRRSARNALAEEAPAVTRRNALVD